LAACRRFAIGFVVALVFGAMTTVFVGTAWAGDKEKILHNFGVARGDGDLPEAGLTFDAAGNLYGTAGGGADELGVVFELAPMSGGKWKESILHTFTGGSDGGYPFDAVTLDASGNVYGTASYGGLSGCNAGYQGCGTVFKLTPTSDGKWKYSVLHSFTGGKDGGNPYGNVILDSAGNLYGTSMMGGNGSCGTVFRLAPGSDGKWNETVLHAFRCGALVTSPEGLVFDAAGNLYGATVGQTWVVYKLTPGSGGKWKETVIHNFRAGGTTESDAVGHLIFDTAGNLYGMASFGGTRGYGGVYKLTQTSSGPWKASVIHAFGGPKDGAFPTGSLIFDPAGNLYGTTWSGGVHENGSVFELTPPAAGEEHWKESLLHSFTGRNDGGGPDGGVIFDNAGNLYGTTFNGGAQSSGVVFELTP
jgi:uncharacterized repeat protein (TIGR03803 family)